MKPSAALSAARAEVKRQFTGPLRLRRQVFSPKRELRRIERRAEQASTDPAFQLGGWESHQPVLLEVLRRHPHGRVLELGMGYASTPIVLGHSDTSVSLETVPEWFDRFSKFATPEHELKLWTDFTDHEWNCPYLEQEWDVAFVDNGPYLTRQSNLMKLADRARFIVCHDTEECYKPAGSDYRWDFSGFRHVWTYTRFDTYTTVVSNAEPIGLDDLPGIAGQPPGRA